MVVVGVPVVAVADFMWPAGEVSAIARVQLFARG